MNHLLKFGYVDRECGSAGLVITGKTRSLLREPGLFVDTQPGAVRNFRAARTARPVLAPRSPL